MKIATYQKYRKTVYISCYPWEQEDYQGICLYQEFNNITGPDKETRRCIKCPLFYWNMFVDKLPRRNPDVVEIKKGTIFLLNERKLKKYL